MTLAYAWNTAPVSGTDISRSLLVTGREWNFPIDINNSFQHTFEVEPSTVKDYAHQLLPLLEKNREVYRHLISEHRAMHREMRNTQLLHPRKFEVNDIVFTNVQVQ